jgi:hypothetical protein
VFFVDGNQQSIINNHKFETMSITRRQFGKLAIAGTAATALGVLATKGVAQTTPSQVILGVRPGTLPNVDRSTDLTESNSIDDSEESTTATITADTVSRRVGNGKAPSNGTNATIPIVVESYDLVTSEVKTVLTTSPVLQPGEQLSGFATLKDGTLIVAASGGGLSKKKQANGNIRLIILREPATTIPLSGLKDRQELLSLARSQDDSLIAIVSNANGTPPYSIVAVNPKTGEVTERNQLPGKEQYSNLTQCTDGTLYAIATEQSGITSIYQIKEGQKNPLKLEGQSWNSGFVGLTCSASNQLFAVGARRYEFPNFIHSVEAKTGELKRLTAFNVSKIAIN